MQRRFAWCFALFIPLVVLSAPAGAQEEFKPKPFDWPQWQGPQRDNISREKGLLQTWPKGGPKELWRQMGLGVGYSTPSIAAGRIFTMGNIGKTEYVIALREKDGTQLWKSEVGAVRSNGGGYPGPRCTPTVDGAKLYALGLNGDFLCLNVSDGTVIWKKFLPKDFSGSPGGWGYTESPLIDGEKVVITPGGGKATLAALNKNSGETIWTSQVPEKDRAGYSSIIVGEVDGLRQYIQFLGGGVVGVRASDGKYLWRYNRPANGTANITTPIFHNNHVFAASNYGVGGALAKLTRTGETTSAEVVYFTNKMQNHHGGVILQDGYLYGNNGGKLACLEFLTGKEGWQTPKTGKGSITCADGRLYYRNENSGDLFLVEINAQKYVEHGRMQQPDRSGKNAWAHPVIANGRLYVADQDLLLCYDVKAR